MIQKGNKISLTIEEVKIAEYIGKKRNAITLGIVGPGNKRDTKNSDEEINVEGVAAEIAFCKLFNVYPDFSTQLRPHTHDCMLNGYSVDAKSNKWIKNPYLLAPKSVQKGKAEIYALLIGKRPDYEFAGWLTEDELLRQENLKIFPGYSKKDEAYAVHASLLHQSLEENLSWCGEVSTKYMKEE